MFDQIFILNCAAVKFEIDNTLRICISVQAVYVLFFFFFQNRFDLSSEILNYFT